SNMTQSDAHEFSGGSNSWTNTRVTSTQGFTRGCYVSWTRGTSSTKHYIIGLDDDPPTGSINYNNIDYCFQVAASSTYYIIREDGDSYHVYMTTAADDVLMITYDGLNVRYYVNGVLKRTTARSIGNPLYLTSSFYSTGSVAENVVFGPMGPVANVDSGGGLRARCEVALTNVPSNNSSTLNTPYATKSRDFNIASVYRKHADTAGVNYGEDEHATLVITYTNAISNSSCVPIAFFQHDDEGTQGANVNPATILHHNTTSCTLWVGPYNTDYTVYFIVI
ncbi:MAG: hypothetical protein QF704_12175, partial [Anaerolineales bacterium]|nr:hypothetical protein [Anaerolineales bacterium]